MLDVFGPEAFETSSRARRRRWVKPVGVSRARKVRLPSYASPAFSATALTALILHLMVDLASRLTLSDPAGTLSALVGMGAVLVILLPFAVLCAKRAHAAWTRAGD
ncbi:hypothetical protein [Azospirillum soli]|uniref:hypothetical protein n=1 Tax=Azospirillum soli TaxID=1304799 RepID=UPI001AE943C2|nr:hypothetical protein [Azospirillum soli]MBP2311195.1 hypothetical protein [Azospirillum soli]